MGAGGMEPYIKEEISAIVDELCSEGRCSAEQARSLLGVFDRVRFADPPLDIRRGLERIRDDVRKGSRAERVSAVARTKAILAAAALVLAVGAGVLLFREGERITPLEALAKSVHGDVRLERDGRLAPLEAGAVLGAGDTVLTGARSFTELRCQDEVIIRIQQNSRFRIDGIARNGDGALRAGLDLSSGTALLNFRKLRRGDVAELRTPTSVAGVRGTSFGVSVSGRGDVRYEVLEGKISVRGRVVLDPAKVQDEDVRRAIEEIERRLAARAVAVEANEVCEVRERDVHALANKVEGAIASLREKSTPLEKERLVGALVTIAAETPPPRIYTAEESPLALIEELRRFHESVRGNEEPAGFAEKYARIQEFDQNVWMERARVSHILVDETRDLFIAVGMDGRIDALRRGSVAWRFRCGSPIVTQPVSDGKTIYLATADERIIALSPDTGKDLWTRKVDGVLYFGSRPAVDGAGLYVATAKGMLYRFDRGGAEEWSIALPAASYSTPVADNRLLFVPLLDGRIHVIDTGLRLAVMRIDSGRIVGSSVIVRDGRLYYANFDGVVTCHNIERDEMEWRHGVRGSIVADPVVDGEYLYVVSSGGDVVKLSLRGNVEWSVNLGGAVERSPIVMGQYLYVLSRRVFYVFDTARGTVQWSIVMPTVSATNIVVSGRTVYFGTEGNGIYRIRR